MNVKMEFNEDIKFILGRPNFWCGSIAPLLRNAGHKIPNKAEEEQAAVIYWLLGLYKKYGEDWKKEADNFLRKAKKGE